MTRREFLAGAAALASGAPAAAPKPNIIIMLMDDLGWRDAGCQGNSFYETPNIDRMAAEGMRFTNAYAACPVCSPTRASVMTGKYPARLRLTDWIPGRKQWPAARLLTPSFEQQLKLEEVTIAEALKPEGYATASIGKWHLGGPDFYPERQGFDLNVCGTERGSPPSYFPPFKIPGVAERGPGDYLTDNLTARAEEFIEASKNRPFFLYLPHFAVHLPLAAKKAAIEKYAAKARTAGEKWNAIYAGMIESMDDSAGRILKKVAALGLDRSTAIFFLSDNGGLRFEGGSTSPVTVNAPLRAGKGHLFEGGLRIPLIVRWPQRIRPGVSDAPVATIDLYPTIQAMTGAKLRPASSVDGVDLTPALAGRGSLRREALFWHYPHYSNQGGVPAGAIRKGGFKLIEFYEDGRLELFNLEDDPGERKNLAASHRAVARELHSQLRRWRESVGAVMPARNPNYDPAKAGQGLTGYEPPTP